MSAKKTKRPPPKPTFNKIIQDREPGFYSVQITGDKQVYWRVLEVSWRWLTTNPWVALIIEVLFGVFAASALAGGAAATTWIISHMLSWFGKDSITPLLNQGLTIAGDIGAIITYGLIVIDGVMGRIRRLILDIRHEKERKVKNDDKTV